MEYEARIEAILSAHRDSARSVPFGEYVDPYLVDVSLKDRWTITDGLYKKWAEAGREARKAGISEEYRDLMELAWYVHP